MIKYRLGVYVYFVRDTWDKVYTLLPSLSNLMCYSVVTMKSFQAELYSLVKFFLLCLSNYHLFFSSFFFFSFFRFVFVLVLFFDRC